MARRKDQTDAGAQEVTDNLHEAQERGYIGVRPDDAPPFETQTVEGVISGANVEAAPEVELGAQAGVEAT